ncbi:MAG: hypothetical protein ACREC5_04495 [Thermoplasmata archaeon]
MPPEGGTVPSATRGPDRYRGGLRAFGSESLPSGASVPIMAGL